MYRQTGARSVRLAVTFKDGRGSASEGGRRTALNLIVPYLTALALCASAVEFPAAGFASGAPSREAGDVTISVALSPTRTADIDATTLFRTLVVDFFAQDDRTTYVQTGDIPAMWLRDSAAQTIPYVRFAPSNTRLVATIRGVIERNAKNILTDPYANAFTAGYKLWEEKWEPDSLAYAVALAWTYYRTTGDRAIFTPRLNWALHHIVTTLECEQHHASCSRYRSRFLENGGSGPEFAETGMIWSAFRPSDDPVRFPFNVPQSAYAAVALDELAELEEEGYHDASMAVHARLIAARVRAGIERYGTVYHRRYGRMYVYEADGLGRVKMMDDANVPNLLGLPYVGYVWNNDPTYLNTRRWVLSPENPYYYRGRYARGLGSSHTPTGWVWPLGLIIEGLTSNDPHETAAMLADLIDTDGYEGLTHESFDPNDPQRWTRPEFGWANATYAELVFRSVAGYPPPPSITRSPFDFPFERASTPRLTRTVEAWRAYAAVQRALHETVF